MTEAVTVLALIGGALVEEKWTAERVRFHREPDGCVLLDLYQADRMTQQVSYRRVDRIHRVLA